MFYGVTLVAAGPAVGAVHGATLVRIVAGEMRADARRCRTAGLQAGKVTR